MFRLEALNNEQRRATAQDALDNVLLSNDETNARHQEEVRQIEARYEESNKQNAHLMQRLEFLEKERETQFTNAARQSAPPQEFALTPKCQEEEILAPVSEVFELLII